MEETAGDEVGGSRLCRIMEARWPHLWTAFLVKQKTSWRTLNWGGIRSEVHFKRATLTAWGTLCRDQLGGHRGNPGDRWCQRSWGEVSRLCLGCLQPLLADKNHSYPTLKKTRIQEQRVKKNQAVRQASIIEIQLKVRAHRNRLTDEFLGPMEIQHLEKYEMFRQSMADG